MYAGITPVILFKEYPLINTAQVVIGALISFYSIDFRLRFDWSSLWNVFITTEICARP